MLLASLSFLHALCTRRFSFGQGIRVQAELDTEFYPTKVKVSDEQMASIHLYPHYFHGEWNYTIKHQ